MTYEELLAEVQRLERVVDGLRAVLASIVIDTHDGALDDATVRVRVRKKATDAISLPPPA